MRHEQWHKRGRDRICRVPGNQHPLHLTSVVKLLIVIVKSRFRLKQKAEAGDLGPTERASNLRQGNAIYVKTLGGNKAKFESDQWPTMYSVNPAP